MSTEIRRATDDKASEEILNAHTFLIDFISRFDGAKRGGIHDFIEMLLYKMIQNAISEIDTYLKTGHKQVEANEIMFIVLDAFQSIIDKSKRNLDSSKKVNFQ